MSTMQGGEFLLDPGVWQLVTIPIQFGYWDKTTNALIHDNTTTAKVKNYILDQIESIINDTADKAVEICNCYFGHENKFRNFIPGVTHEDSSQNFPLAYISTGDSDDYKQIIYDGIDQSKTFVEYTGFWLKSKWADPLIISWGEKATSTILILDSELYQ